MNKLKFFSIFLLAAAMVYVWGCGDNSTTGTPGTGGTAPTLNMTVGSIYSFSVDSLPTSGGVTHTSLQSYNTFLAQGRFHDKDNAFKILTETRDTATNSSLGTDTFYVCYEGGKFYQWGMLQLISPSITASWDLVADFNVSQGTTFNIATGVPINIIPNTTANITGRIAVDTTFNTAGWGNIGINCYRSEIVADILLSSLPIGKVYVDYYIGDADPTTNPSGMVRVKLRPVNLTVYQAAGLDQSFLRRLN